jgi:small subunit ribosomal protein S18
VSGNDSQQQREVARAIKNAREMGLLPYASRVTTQRRNNRRDDGPRDRDRDRDGGGDRQNDKAPDQAEAQVAESTPAETTETGGEE